MFFSVYYGSTDGDFPQRAFSSDDRSFEARLSAWTVPCGHRRGQREPVGACDPIDSAFRSAGR